MSFQPPQIDFSSFIGKKLGTEVTEEQIKSHCNAASVRVLTPLSPMTMDLRHDRVNIFIENDKKTGSSYRLNKRY